jgi:hypothetical protein
MPGPGGHQCLVENRDGEYGCLCLPASAHLWQHNTGQEVQSCCSIVR